MTSRFLVPTLAALAAIPTASAFDIAGDAWELSIEPRIQTRIEFGSTSTAGGDDQDPWEGTANENPQTVNFYVRRARIYFKGKSEDGWKFNYTIFSDNIGITEDRDGGNIDLRYAWVGKEIAAGDIKHYIQFGIDKHTSNMADVDSSSKNLFPNARLAAEYAGPRSVGLDYSLSHPVFGLKVGIADEAGDENNDWYFYARVATSLKEEWKVKRTESFLGKEGFGHEAGLGLDILSDGSGDGDGTEDDGLVTFNVDYLIHYNNITGLFELSSQSRDEAAGDNSGLIVSAQAGYALPQDNGTVIEPAVRIQYVDNDTDEDEEAGTLVREGGDSGIYFDIGVNYYLDGHSNKFQAALQSFSPEEGDGDGFIFRLAHQLDF